MMEKWSHVTARDRRSDCRVTATDCYRLQGHSPHCKIKTVISSHPVTVRKLLSITSAKNAPSERKRLGGVVACVDHKMFGTDFQYKPIRVAVLCFWGSLLAAAAAAAAAAIRKLFGCDIGVGVAGLPATSVCAFFVEYIP